MAPLAVRDEGEGECSFFALNSSVICLYIILISLLLSYYFTFISTFILTLKNCLVSIKPPTRLSVVASLEDFSHLGYRFHLFFSLPVVKDYQLYI